MAMLIKDLHQLMTLRCWIGFREDKNPPEDAKQGFASVRVVRTQLFDGAQPIGDPRDTSFEQLGLSADGIPPTKAWLPLIDNTAIGDQLRRAIVDNPAVIWLHIPQDSYLLALLAWEEMAAQVIKTPILRIGNFLDDPYRPGPTPVMAICASQPIGDGPYPLDTFVAALLHSLAIAAVRAGVVPKIYVFADLQWIPALDHLTAEFADSPLTVEIVPPPPGDADAPTTDSSAAASGSIWLKWITDVLAGQTMDIVHFITPGWYSENHGAIALAQTPRHNEGGGEFVGASELAGFFDKVGCRVMAFSSPDMPEWEWGQRMLAFELSWLRAGPVLVFEHGVPDYEAFCAIYDFLFGRGSAAINFQAYRTSPPQLTCHPQLLAATQMPLTIDTPISRSRFDFSPAEPAAVEPDPGDDLLARRVDQAAATLQPTRELSKTEQWEANGATLALDFVKSLN